MNFSNFNSNQNSFEKDDQKELHLKIKNALPKLTATQAEVIQLYYDNGMTQEKIAAKLGISRSTVQCHLRAALKKLKREISQ